jgi:aldehyde dehydrogenase (NAD+)
MTDSVASTNQSGRDYKSARIEDRLFINGEFVPSLSGKKFDVSNPNNEKIVASVYEAGAEDVDVAVQAAKTAFPAWSALSAAERANYLNLLADAVEKNVEELSYLEAISMGKPCVGDSMCSLAQIALEQRLICTVFNAMAVQMLRYFASKALDIQGDTSLNTANFVNMSWRQPFGVCGAIIPWNVPLTALIQKIAPALAAGNTMVLKSSERSPLSSLLFGRLANDAGLPKGVLNILSGYGRPCGEAIARHMDIRKVSFTGSVIAGRAIKKAAAESNLKNVTLELGGKSPLVIFEDADLAKAAPAAAFSILCNSGQACIASSRVYVHADIAEKFIEEMKRAMIEFGRSGDACEAGTKRGPLADKVQFERVMSYLTYANETGLEMPIGGKREGSLGFFVEPTMVVNVPEDSRLMRDEIFGPVVCVNTFTDEAEVMRRANDSEFGLYASVFTKDISRALRIAKQLEAGSVGVNCTSPMLALDMPFGGFKQSGDGRELSKYATDYWTELKSVFISL